MNLKDVIKLAIAGGFIAADKKPEELEAAIMAADAGMPGNVASSKEIMDKRAKDRRARDAKMQEDRAARDSKRASDRAARDSKRASDRAARDAKFGAADRNDDPEHTNDEEMKKEAEDESKEEMEAEDENYMEGSDPSSPGGSRSGGKTAVDSAEVDARIAAAVAASTAARDALYAARTEVEPILGRTAFDSAGNTYRAALKTLGVATDGVPDSALPAMLKLATDRAKPAPVGMDSAASASFAKLIPGYDRIR